MTAANSSVGITSGEAAEQKEAVVPSPPPGEAEVGKVGELIAYLKRLAYQPIVAPPSGYANACGDAADALTTAQARIAELEAVLRECLAGHDCPMCDYGKLRNATKEHWDTCAFARAERLLSNNGATE